MDKDLNLDSGQLARVTAETSVRQVEWHEELASTNDRAVTLAAQPALDLPLLVIAGRQTAGRGRGAHRWTAGLGALTFSLVYDATALGLAAPRLSQVSLAAGLAVAESLAAQVPSADVKLKWPNDVFLAGRKVCGILVEASAATGRITLGVGLNVNNTPADAVSQLRETATALSLAAGKPLPLIEVLIPLLQAVEIQLGLLRGHDPRLPQRWRPYCMLEGRTVHLAEHHQTTVGLCRGLDTDGALLLETPQGPRRFISGTIQRIEPAAAT